MKDNDPGPPAEDADVGKGPATSPFALPLVVLLLAGTFLAFSGTFHFQFVHDDRTLILQNPFLLSWRFFFHYFQSGIWPTQSAHATDNAYRPLVLIWFRLNESLFGLAPGGWHVSTVVAHVAATYGVYELARRILQYWPGALFSALIFGFHPIHIEAVAWVAGVPEPLLVAFLIPAYLCWLQSRESKAQRWKWLSVSLVLYILAMLSKETALALLLIVFVSAWLDFPCALDPAGHGRMQRFRQATEAILPFALATAAYLVARTLALGGFSHPRAQITWLTVVLTWPSLLLFYAKLMLWPVGLSPFYGLKYVLHPTLLNTALPTLILLLTAVGLWKWASRSRSAALAIPWLIFPLLPVLNVQVFGNGNFAHNRYLYLPSVGFSMLVAVALNKIKLGAQSSTPIQSPHVWIGLGLALLMAYAIHVEDRYYASDTAFYSFAYSRMGNPDPVIGMDYANTLAEQGGFSRAAAIYRELIQAHPDMWTAYFNLGYMYYQLGELDLARQYLSKAAAGDPTQAAAFLYLGLTDLKLNRMDEAEANVRCAIALAPMTPNYHFALGIVLKVKGNSAGALAEFSKELELNPAHQAAAQQVTEIQRQVVRK